MARPGGAGSCSPGLERVPRRSVGELRLLFEARCAAVAAAAAAGDPRARGAKRRGGQVPNGLPRASPAPVIPQLTVTAEEPDVPQASPGPPEPEGDCLPAGDSHLQQPRRLSTSSLSSTGSSSLLEDSEDDLLSDSESRSRGNVQLETSEDVVQVRAAEAGQRGGNGARARRGPFPLLRRSVVGEGARRCGRPPAPAVFTWAPQVPSGSPGRRRSESAPCAPRISAMSEGRSRRPGGRIIGTRGTFTLRGNPRGERKASDRFPPARPLCCATALPPPLPRFPSLEWEWSGALQAPLGSRCRLLPAPARGVDARAGRRAGLGAEARLGDESSPPGAYLKLAWPGWDKVN